MDRYVISVCGPNGAGKSTFTKSVLSNLNLPIVDPDLYSTQGISEIAAGKLSIQLINAYLSQGVSLNIFEPKFETLILGVEAWRLESLWF